MSKEPCFTAEDFIFPNNYGDAVRIVAEKSAAAANAKIAPKLERLNETVLAVTNSWIKAQKYKSKLQKEYARQTEQNQRLRAAIAQFIIDAKRTVDVSIDWKGAVSLVIHGETLTKLRLALEGT